MLGHRMRYTGRGEETSGEELVVCSEERSRPVEHAYPAAAEVEKRQQSRLNAVE